MFWFNFIWLLIRMLEISLIVCCFDWWYTIVSTETIQSTALFVIKKIEYLFVNYHSLWYNCCIILESVNKIAKQFHFAFEFDYHLLISDAFFSRVSFQTPSIWMKCKSALSGFSKLRSFYLRNLLRNWMVQVLAIDVWGMIKHVLY